MSPVPVLGIYGEEESNPFQNELYKMGFKILKVPGDHHYDENVSAILKPILESFAAI